MNKLDKNEKWKCVCPKCNGYGYLWKNPTGKPGYKCPRCNTKGYIYKYDLMARFTS